MPQGKYWLQSLILFLMNLGINHLSSILYPMIKIPLSDSIVYFGVVLLYLYANALVLRYLKEKL